MKFIRAILTSFGIFSLVPVNAAKSRPECDDKTKVCGTDGFTYASECELLQQAAEGVTVLRNGSCPPSHTIQPDGPSKNESVGGVPSKVGKLKLGLDDVEQVSVLSFQGLAEGKTMNFDKKRVVIPTSANLVKLQEEIAAAEKKKASGQKSNKSKTTTQGNASNKKEAKAKVWYGDLQDGTGSASMIQDLDGNIAGSVMGIDGVVYNFNTVVDPSSGKSIVRVVTLALADLPSEAESNTRERYLMEQHSLRGNHNVGDRQMQSSTCSNVPLWHDADGPTYDCDWYAKEGNCAAYGNSYAFAGYTAKQACCACGGGGACSDRPGWYGQWYDKDGPTYNCAWYAQDPSRRCSQFGGSRDNFGYTANEACCICGGGGAGTIDALVIYTTKAKKTEANGVDDAAPIERLVALAALQVNVAFDLFGISSRLRVVKTVETSYDETGRNTTTILTHLTKPGDAFLEYDAFQNSVGADVVIIIVEDGTNISGKASSIGNTVLTNRKGYAVVARNRATSTYTFAHELGHLLNARHEDDFAGTSNNMAYAASDCTYSSIMSYTCPRALRYSNIISTFNGKPIGNITRNNARAMLEFSPQVAAYKSSISSCVVANPSFIGDGWCDVGTYNSELCGWDGGDCCAETCVPSKYSCTNAKVCLDPQVLKGVQITASMGSNKCLEAIAATSTTRTVTQSNCGSSTYQLWVYNRNEKKIKNLGNSWCLGYTAVGTTPVTTSCTSTTYKLQWEEGDNGRIQAVGTNLCVCTSGSGVSICNCDTSPTGSAQEWLYPEKFFG